jgi:hypothetical protein
MPFDKIDLDSIDEARRKSIAKSIQPVSVEELKKLGNDVFHDLDDPGVRHSFDSSKNTATPRSITPLRAMAFISFIVRTKTGEFGFCRGAEKEFCPQRVDR